MSSVINPPTEQMKEGSSNMSPRKKTLQHPESRKLAKGFVAQKLAKESLRKDHSWLFVLKDCFAGYLGATTAFVNINPTMPF